MYLKLATGAGEIAQWVSACSADTGPQTTNHQHSRESSVTLKPSTQRRGDRKILGTCWAAILATQQAPGPVRNPVSRE